jgi:micrococcal nuclease
VEVITPAYRYRATCARVIDGDTFVAQIDLGFYASIQVHVRVLGLFCPELHAAGGADARSFALRWLTGIPLIIESFHDRRSFERWVCDVWSEAGEHYADAAIAAGMGTATA